jgi:hypothetical protein
VSSRFKLQIVISVPPSAFLDSPGKFDVNILARQWTQKKRHIAYITRSKPLNINPQFSLVSALTGIEAAVLSIAFSNLHARTSEFQLHALPEARLKPFIPLQLAIDSTKSVLSMNKLPTSKRRTHPYLLLKGSHIWYAKMRTRTFARSDLTSGLVRFTVRHF